MEREILIGLSKGYEDSFKYIFHKYYSKVKAFSYGFLKDTDDAEDLTQLIFIKLWEKRKIFASVDNFDSYLFTLSKHTILNYIETRHFIPIDLEEIPETSETVTPHEEAIANELQLLIDLAVDNMPPQRKLIYKLSRQEGITNDEIAVKLGIHKKTVENHLNHALKELKKIIGLVTILYNI